MAVRALSVQYMYARQKSTLADTKFGRFFLVHLGFTSTDMPEGSGQMRRSYFNLDVTWDEFAAAG